MTEKKICAAIMMMDGFEESETIQICDLLKRAGLEVRTYFFGDSCYVKGMQDIVIKADEKFKSEVVKQADVIVVPGGRTCAAKFIENQEFMDTLKWFDDTNKMIAGMCSGTTVLEAAGVLVGKRATGYTGYEDKLKSAVFVNDVAVWDQNVVTSQGPATPYPFAFKIMDAFGIDSSEMKHRLLYDVAGGK